MVDVKQLGEQAMILIGDYPLYAKTSGITYEEAIEIAKVLYPETNNWQQIIEEEL